MCGTLSHVRVCVPVCLSVYVCACIVKTPSKWAERKKDKEKERQQLKEVTHHNFIDRELYKFGTTDNYQM